MISYPSLRDLRLEALKAAADEWGRAATSLGEAAETAEHGVRTKAMAGEWTGQAADEGRRALASAVQRVAHGRDHARTVGDLLTELHEKLTDCQRRLRAVEDEARERGVVIAPDGRVRGEPLPQGSETWNQEAIDDWGTSDEDVARVAADLGRVLEEAATYDGAAAHALNQLTQGDKVFRPVDGVYEDLDAAERELYTDAAREAVALAQRDELTAHEVNRLDRHLEQYGDNPYFAEEFALGMGPYGALEFWAGPLPEGVSGERRDSLAENFSSTLGVATQVDSAAMRRWQDEMISLGAEPVGDGSQGYSTPGFLVMSQLMAQGGEYGEDFMLSYGAALEEADEQRDTPWSHAPWPMDTAFGGDLELDPVTGYMSALSRTPDVATTFFTEDSDRVDYFMDERMQPEGAGYVADEGGHNASIPATGDALQAGATGVDPRDPLAERPTEYTPQQAAVRDRAVATAAELENDLHPDFRVPMAGMLGYHSEYVYDMTKESKTEGEAAHLRKVALEIARDPEAYGNLNGAMAHEYAEQVRAGDRTDGGGGLNALRGSVTSSGFFEKARINALALDQEDSDWKAKNAYNLFGAGIGSLPVVGNVANHALDQLTARWARGVTELDEKELEEESLDISVESVEYMHFLIDLHLDTHEEDLTDDQRIDRRSYILSQVDGKLEDGKAQADVHA